MTIAFITGANKGIGFETARLLGKRGMTVLVGARDRTRGADAVGRLTREGLDARLIQVDVTDDDSVRSASASVADEFGHLDVLVNNAGIVRGDGAGAPSDTTIETFRTVVDTNVYGPVRVTNAMLPLLLGAPSPRVVNVSSEVGSITAMTDPDGPMAGMASVPYPTSKAALNMVTAMYAKELAGTPIKVNAANPGYCATDFNGNSGFRTAEQGAEVVVHLATLPDDGPTGVLWGYVWATGGEERYGLLPW